MDKWEKFDEASLPKKEIFIATKTWKILLMKIKDLKHAKV